MNITENFTLEEFMHSDTAIAKGIKNDPGSREKLAITNLCAKLLQPLRDAIGKPISINSGYRCPELNAAVGGCPYISTSKRGSSRFEYWWKGR